MDAVNGFELSEEEIEGIEEEYASANRKNMNKLEETIENSYKMKVSAPRTVY